MRRTGIAAVAVVLLGALVPPARGGEGEGKADANGAIVGRILLRGTPSAGTVEVRRRTDEGTWALEDGPAVATAKADATGAFRVPDLPEGRYEVRAVVPGNVAGFSRVFVPAGCDAEAPVQVPGGSARLTGRVTWEDGRPFVGVVEWDPFWLGQKPFGRTQGATYARTDAEGKFAFEGIAPARAILEAVVPGVFRGRLRHVRAPAENLEFVLGAESRVIHGTVVEVAEGKPVAGARIEGGTWLFTSRARTSAEGKFELRVHGRAEVVTATAKGFAKVAIPAGRAQDGVVLRLARGAVVLGRVTSTEGKPVSGATVVAVCRSQGEDEEVASATTDADGRYRIEGLSPGDAQVAVAAPGLVPPGIAPWTKAVEESLRVRLEAGAPATRDFVVTRSGAARVRVHDHEGRRVPFPMLTVAPVGFHGTFWHESALHDLTVRIGNSEGVVTVPTLLPDHRHRVNVAAQGFADDEDIDVLAPAGVVVPYDVEMQESQRREVEVLDDATGQPVVGAVVTAYQRRGTSWNGLTDRWLTDASGRAVLAPLPAGDLRCEVETDDYAKVERAPFAPSGVTSVRLKPAKTVRARVVGPEGIGARSVHVAVERPGGRGWGNAPEAWIDVACGETFTTPPLERDDVVLSASVVFRGRKYEGRVGARAGGEVVEVRLESLPVREVRLKVTGPDGKPVPRAQAHLYGLVRGQRNPGRTGEIRDGEWRAEVDPDTDRVVVEVYGAEDANGDPLPLGATETAPLEPGEKTVDVRLPPERRLSGRVRDEAGKGIAEVRVEAFPRREMGATPDFFLGYTAHAEATTGPDGTFDLERLGQTGYEIRFHPPGPFAPPDPVDVAAREKGPLDVVAERGHRVTVTVLDPAGHPVREASVSLWWRTKGGRQFGHENRYTGWLTSSDGTVTFDRIVDGRRYDIAVRAPEGRAGLGRLHIDDWDPTNAELRLGGGRRVTGVVRDHEGRPLPHFPVALRPQGEKAWNIEICDEEGRFTFEDVRAATVRVKPWGRLPAPGDEDVGTMEVAPDAKEVALTVDGRRLVRVVTKDPLEGSVEVSLGGREGMAFGGEDLRPGRPTYFTGLDPDRPVTLYAAGSRGRCFYAEGVRPGGPPVEAVFAAAVIVRGKIAGLPKSPAFLYLAARRNGLALRIEPQADGTFESPPLPAGTRWNFQVLGPAFATDADVDVAEGATVTLKVR